jgi:hypothetical protein
MLRHGAPRFHGLLFSGCEKQSEQSKLISASGLLRERIGVVDRLRLCDVPTMFNIINLNAPKEEARERERESESAENH